MRSRGEDVPLAHIAVLCKPYEEITLRGPEYKCPIVERRRTLFGTKYRVSLKWMYDRWSVTSYDPDKVVIKWNRFINKQMLKDSKRWNR